MDLSSIEPWLLLAIAFWIGYYYVKEKYSFFKKRNIPFKQPTFPFGNAWKSMTMRGNIVTQTESLYRDFPDARVVGLYQGMRAAYVVRDPDLVYRILIKDFSHFHDRGITTDEKTNPLEGHLFNMAGNKWKTLRNKLTPVFTSGKLKGMFPLMDACVESFIAQLDKEVGKDVEIKDALSRLTTDVIGSCAFGIDSEAIKDPDSQFRKMGKRIFNPSRLEFIKQILRFMFPKIMMGFKIKTVPRDINDFFFNITKQNFELRLKEGNHRNDFMQLLLELREKGRVSIDNIEKDDEEDAYLHQGSHYIEGGENLELTDNLLTAQAFVFFLAGFETSATGMSFTVYFLAKHPDVQEKVRLEILEAKKKYGSFTYDAIKSMKYLEACINEAMRLYTPVGTLFRKCNKTLRIDDDLVIEEGHNVFVSLNGLHKDPAYFPDPESYKPERFLTGSIIPGSFLPFGDGPRICIAQRFALVELKLGLAKMIERYRIELSPKMPRHEPLEIIARSFIPQPVNGILVQLTKLSA